MSTVVLKVSVPGKPRPQGSMTLWTDAAGNERAKYGDETVKHRNYLISVLKGVWDGTDALTGPCAVRLSFVFERPNYHYLPVNRKRPVRELRPDAPRWVTIAPDDDKLVRLVADALTIAGVWRDDAQMALVRAEKVYGDSPYTEIEVHAL